MIRPQNSPGQSNRSVDARSLAAALLETAERCPERTALLSPSKRGFRHYTYREMVAMVFDYARALSSFGLTRGDRVVIIGETCMQWALVDWAAQSLGIVVVPIYPTLPPDQACYIARDSEAKVVVAQNAKLAAKLADLGLRSTCWADGEANHLLERAKSTNLLVDDWREKLGRIGRDHLATLIYTSGTTGDPKGVMLTHDNFLSLCKGILQSLPISEEDRFLSFLPLSHVFERFAGHVLPIVTGATIAYAGSVASLATDMVNVKPTIMLCVPRFLEATRARILDGVEKQPPLRRRLFAAAMAQGKRNVEGRFAPAWPLMDGLVAAKVRRRFGGAIRFFVSGGAALAPHVSDFYRAMGLNVLQGYGLTETTAAACVNHPDHNIPRTVGPPIPGVEIRLAPDSEILIRGPGVMRGYWNKPEETASAFDEQGWFQTGDLGAFEGEHLRVTDRKKDILVLGNGKNIAPQPIENKIKESELIEEAVLFGDGMEYVCALIVPQFEMVRRRLNAQGQTAPEDDRELVEDPRVRALLKSELDAVNRTLADFERVKRHELLSEPFSVDSGDLTPSLKVRRAVVRKNYAEELRRMQR